MTLLMVLASMMVSTTYAQEIYKTVADVPMVQLNNGILMPQFGLGTFLQPSDSVCEQSCLTALKAGYRHIDTAHAYNDEAGVGRAVKKSGIPREEIWITSKLWPTEYGEGKTMEAIDKMLERMQLDYIDLLYVHTSACRRFRGCMAGYGESRCNGQGTCVRNQQFRRERRGVQQDHERIAREAGCASDRMPPLCTATGHARKGQALRYSG